MPCKPITTADIVGGQFHIAVGVAVDGSMSINYPTFYGQPMKDCDSWWIRIKKRQPRQHSLGSHTNSVFGGFDSMSDLGLDPTQRYNHHRVFKYNGENRRLLADLVERQDLVAYLTLIGVEDPHGTIGTIMRDYERWVRRQELDRQLVDTMVDYHDDGWGDFDSGSYDDGF